MIKNAKSKQHLSLNGRVTGKKKRLELENYHIVVDKLKLVLDLNHSC